MSWPIGYWPAGVPFKLTRDGVILGDDRPVTGPRGWVDLPLPPIERKPGGPTQYSLRVRLSVDAEGQPFLYAEEVELGGQRYAGLSALARARGDWWLSLPIVAVRKVIAARVADPVDQAVEADDSSRSGERRVTLPFGAEELAPLAIPRTGA